MHLHSLLPQLGHHILGFRPQVGVGVEHYHHKDFLVCSEIQLSRCVGVPLELRQWDLVVGEDGLVADQHIDGLVERLIE